MKNTLKGANADALTDHAAMLADMQALRAAVLEEQKKCLAQWQPRLQTRAFLPSAANLAAYIGLRRHDVRHLQGRLAALGLSSLGRSEGHVLATLDAVIMALQLMLQQPHGTGQTVKIKRAIDRSAVLFKRHTDRLLGRPPASRWVRIMVTLPSEAADDYALVKSLLERGMDCARINCAHDGAEAWQRMVGHIRQAERETGRACKIAMDLGGPKLRTGPVAAGQPVLRLRTRKDEKGNLRQAAQVILDASGAPGRPAGCDANGQPYPARLAVAEDWLQQLKAEDAIRFRDIRGKQRELIVLERRSALEVVAQCDASAYIGPGTPLKLRTKSDGKPVTAVTPAGAVASLPVEIRLFADDLLRLTRDGAAGEPALSDEEDATIAPPHIACQPPEIIDQLKPGDRVWIDDGRIGTKVETINGEGALLRVTRARPNGERLLPEKGLNFPDTDLKLPTLTDKDFADLDFAVAHADIIGYSFVQDGAGMDQLVAELEQRGGGKLGIIAKIETRAAIRNLPDIIIHGAGRHPFGIMIARGDLALEIGYERLAEMQEEILWLCEA
ncbi:MAG: pyruvate kinase, partial [Sulfuricella sp.]